jgi:molybdopterin synthase catalytic subunit
VKFFASYREALGKEQIEVETEEKTDISCLLNILKRDHPELGNLIEPVIISVNREYASYDTILKEGDEVALLPPVSGG